MSKKNRIKNREANLQKRIDAVATRESETRDILTASEVILRAVSQLDTKGPLKLVAHTCGTRSQCSEVCEYQGLFTLGVLTTPELAEELFASLALRTIPNYVAFSEGDPEEEVNDLENKGVCLHEFDGHFLVFARLLFAYDKSSHRVEEYKNRFITGCSEKCAA